MLGQLFRGWNSLGFNSDEFKKAEAEISLSTKKNIKAQKEASNV